MLIKARANIQPFNLHTQKMPPVFNNSLLNKKTELITKCRHQNKYTLLSHNFKD